MDIRRTRTGLLAGIVLLCLALVSAAQALTRPKVATDESGEALRIRGSLVLIEPDIELSLVTAGGLHEPRKQWSETARRLFPEAVRRELAGRPVDLKPDYDVPDDLDPASPLGQIVRLNEAVAVSIAQYSQPGSQLATKKDAHGRPRMDWSLGPGVTVLREATGADYAMFVYVRDSYASGGRTALRVFGLLLGAAMGGVLDIGGGYQIGVATVVDLRTGQVVWYNLIANQSGDLRDEEGARKTVRQVLQKLPL